MEYQRCNCSIEVGWNMTNTRCIENYEMMECLFQYNHEFLMQTSLRELCLSECPQKCNRKSIETEINIIHQKLAPRILQDSLKMWLEYVKSESYLPEKLLETYQENNQSKETQEVLSESYSRFLLYFKGDTTRLKVIETVPLVTLSSFMGNLGGLEGMWLGFSAVSVLIVIEKICRSIIFRQTSTHQRW